MLALKQDNRKQKGKPLKKITTMLALQQPTESKVGAIDEDFHNASITTRQQKAKWEPLKKITTMLALQQDNRKQSGNH